MGRIRSESDALRLPKAMLPEPGRIWPQAASDAERKLLKGFAKKTAEKAVKIRLRGRYFDI